jgi:hypothetical protein
VMLGVYENFPHGIHLFETYTSSLSKRKLQEKVVQVFQEVNIKSFSFEEVCNPSVPNCEVVFEFGIAETENFCYLDKEEANKLRDTLSNESLHVMDWFCSIKYYKDANGKKAPLRFDYYMLRMEFSEKATMEFQVFHEKGPRHISPEDLIFFIQHKINQALNRKVLKRIRV